MSEKLLAFLDFNFLIDKMRVKIRLKQHMEVICKQQLFIHYITILLPFSYLWQEKWDPEILKGDKARKKQKHNRQFKNEITNL